MHCEETVMRDGMPSLCGRPVDERGYCDRPREHVEPT